MDQLFWPSVPLLNAVHLQEEVTVRARDALSGCVLASLQPLRRCEVQRRLGCNMAALKVQHIAAEIGSHVLQ